MTELTTSEYKLTQNSTLKDGKVVITIPFKDCEVQVIGFGLKPAKWRDNE